MLHLLTHKAAACLALVIVAFSTPPTLLAETPVQAAADGSGCRPIEEFSPAFRCFRHQLLLPRPYLILTKPLRLDIQCQRGASVKIGWKYLDD